MPLTSNESNTRRRFFRRLAAGAAALPALAVQKKAAPQGGKARMVPTLTGPVAPEKLGTTLLHEHVLYGNIPDDLRADSIEFALTLLRDAARVGVDTLVCMSPERDIRLYQQIAQRSPVKIIASTGGYIYRRMSKFIQEMNEQQMYERIVREVTEGIDGTKLRAGIIKAAGAKTPLTEWEKAAFRAAGRAQKTTGTPVGTHAIFEPREQFDLLVKSGADPNRCCFAHVEAEFGWGGRKLEQETDYLLAIAKEGGSLLFNNFGFEFDTPWPDLVYIIRNLCDKGYANRVLTSMDCNWEWKKGKRVFEASEKHPETARRTFAYMITDAVPAMLKAGFSAQEVRTFLVDNPRRFFGNA